MGLDVTAYAKIEQIGGAPDNDDGTFYRAMVHPAFPGRGEGLVDGALYRFARRLDFRAGSYTGYSEWRNTLAQLAGYVSAEKVWELPDPQGPFIELINFADNEGDFGAAVCAKLAKDFVEHEQRILAGAGDEYFCQKYRSWRAAFEMGADAGAVQLH